MLGRFLGNQEKRAWLLAVGLLLPSFLLFFCAETPQIKSLGLRFMVLIANRQRDDWLRLEPSSGRAQTASIN